MRIALVTSLLWGGGAARVLVAMANHWGRAGHEVTLLCFEDGSRPPFYPVDPRVTVQFLDIYGRSRSPLESIRNNLRRCRVIRSALLARKPDVVVSFIDTANVRVLIAMLGTGVPVIVSERVHPAHEDIGWRWSLLRRLTYRLAASLVVQTGEIREYFRNWPLRDLRVIHNPARAIAPAGTAPAIPRPSVVAVGRMAAQKNYALLARAFAAARRKHPQWSLAIAGKRAPDPALDEILHAEGLGGQVRFLGQIADVGGLLEQTDIYVLSSSHEGFPNALCEAMSAGAACIATNCPSGPADIIEHGVNGLLVENGNADRLAEALERLMGDAELRARLGANARGLAERYAESRIMSLWDRCLADVISAN